MRPSHSKSSLRGLAFVAASVGALSAPAVAQTTAPFYTTFDDLVLFDLDDDEATTDDQVRLNGSLATYYQTNVCTGLDGLSCPYDFEARGSIVAVSSLMLEAKVAATLSYQTQKPLELLNLPLFEVSIFGVDLAVSMRLITGFIVSGTVQAGASVDLVGVAPFAAEFHTNPGFGFQVTEGPAAVFKAATPQVDGSSGAELVLSPVLGVEFHTTINQFPVPSPAFSALPTLRFAVEPLADPWWSLDAELGIYFSMGWYPGTQIVPFTPMYTGSIAMGAGAGLFGGLPFGTDVRWAQAMDSGGKVDQVLDAVPAGDGSETLLVTNSTIRGGVTRIASDGSIISAHEWLLSHPSAACQIDADTFLLAGTTGTRLWAGEYTGAGAFAWAQQYDLTGLSGIEVEDIEKMPAGGYVIGAHAFYSGARHQLVVVLDAAGTIQWANIYAPNGVTGALEDVVVSPNGDIAFCGQTTNSPNHAWNGTAVTLLDSTGVVQWQRVIAGSTTAGPAGRALVRTDDGDYVVAMRFNRNPLSPEPANVAVIRLSGTGNRIWHAFYSEDIDALGATGVTGNSFFDEPTDLYADELGFVMTGVTNIAADREPWIWRLDHSGRVISLKRYRAPGEDELRLLRPTPDGGLLAIGTTQSFAVGGDTTKQLFLLKTGADGLVPLDGELGGSAINPRVRIGTHDAPVADVSDPPVAIPFLASNLSINFVSPINWAIEDIAR